MAGGGDTSRFYNFFGKEGLAGGLNVSDNPLIVSPQQMVNAKNISVSRSLSRKKRPGQVAYHLGSFEGTASYPEMGTPIRGIMQYHRFASSSGDVLEDIVLHQGEKIWTIQDRLSEGIERQNGFPLSDTGVPRYQVFEGILFFVTSEVTDGYKKWNGLAQPAGDVEDAIGPPDGDGTLLGTWLGRMVMAGNNDFPYRVYISAPYDPENWTTDGATSFDLTYDGEPGGVTAIFPEKDGLLFIATSRSIYQLSAVDPNDEGTFSLNRMTTGIGCVGQPTVVATANDILFLSQRGLHSLRKIIVSDQSEVTFLSKDVQTIFTNLLNPLLLERSWARWDEKDNLYIVTVASDGQQTQDIVLCYNINFDLWLIWEDIDARSLGQLVQDGRAYVMAGREDGKITYLDGDQTADLDSGFACTFKTGKFFPDGDITHEKEFVSVTVLVSADQISDITIGWSIDSLDLSKNGALTTQVGQSASLLGSTFILGQSTLGIGRFVPIRVSVGEVGYNFQLEISASGDSGLEFHGWVLEVTDANTNYA
jgi:hypothetical protein